MQDTPATNGYIATNDERASNAKDGLTVYSTDAEVSTVVRAAPSIFNLFRSVKTDVEDTIASFLARPIPLYSGGFTTTDTNAFSRFKIPDDIISVQPFANKVMGYRFLRADFRFRLVVNATRFQSGIYRVVFQPTGGAPCTNTNLLFHGCHMTQITQLPHVEVNISCDSEGVLEVPWQSMYTHSVINQTSSDYNNIGVVYTYPYVNLKTGSGSSSCTFTLFVSMHNVELTGPTVPQSGWSISPQSGNISDRELQTRDKPLSGGLSLVGAGLSKMSSVPLIGNAMRSAAWVVDAMAGASLAMGFSRPNDPVATRIVRRTVASMAACDVMSNPEPLSLFASNKVTNVNGLAGTAIDEMSIKHLVGIPAFYTTTTWANGDAQNANKFHIAVSPSTFSTSFTESSLSNVVAATPLYYFASLFNLWRGSIVFTFKMAKTEFHSGRLSVTFYPWSPDKGGSYTLVAADMPYLFREIVDIRETTQFTVVVPYISNQAFTDFGTAIGYLDVNVLDTLQAPSSVTSNINIMMEVSGGPDFVVASPATAVSIPYTPLAYQSGWSISYNKCREAFVELGSTPKDMVPAEFCVGEAVLSLRSLVKRYHVIPSVSSQSNSGTDFVITTAAIPVVLNYSGTAKYPAYFADPYAYVAACFGMARGGLRFVVSSSVVASSITYPCKMIAWLSRNVYTSLSSFINNTSISGTGSGSPTVITPIAEGLAEVFVPMYHNNAAWANLDSLQCEYLAFTPGKHPNANILNVRCSATPTNGYFTVMRACADDFEFIQFISTPLLYTASSTTNVL